MKQTEKGFYACEACGMKYKQQIHAYDCENWCKKHQSCNIKIIKYAIKEDEQ